jgi:nicotinamidase-related amidase
MKGNPYVSDQCDNPISQALGSSPLEISARRTALLVVDMQYFDADRDEGEGRTARELGVAHYFEEYFAQIDAIIPRIQDLLALFRRKRMEIIHIRVSELTEDSRDVGRKQLVRGFVVPAGSREADFLDELRPVGDELVVNKSSSGVFPVTNLDRLLRNMGITTLIFTGTSTNGCVESAVRDAVDLGYDVVVVSDACAAGTLDTHDRALCCLEGVLTHVLSTDQLVSRIDPLDALDPKIRSGLERVKPYLPKPPENTESVDQDPYDAILPPALQLPLSRSNTALVLVDAQRLTCDPACGLGAMVAARGRAASLLDYYGRVQVALAGMGQLLEACRVQDILAIHVRTAGRLPDGKDLSRKVRAQGFLFGPGSPEAEFMPAASPRAGEIILEKPASGIFTGTGLDELLRNLGLENLILAGVSYDGAIEGSIRSTSDRGYGLVVVPDACATYHAAQQDFLWRVESGVIQVRSVEQIVAQIRSW